MCQIHDFTGPELYLDILVDINDPFPLFVLDRTGRRCGQS